MTDSEKIELLVATLRPALQGELRLITVVDEKTRCRPHYIFEAPNIAWAARNALEQIGAVLPPEQPDPTLWNSRRTPYANYKGTWNYALCGYDSKAYGLDSNGKKIIVDHFTPACAKCLAAEVELSVCVRCCQEPTLGTKVRYFCDKCLKNHKNPLDCSDCTG